jgi:hypothetical protein
MINAKLQEFVCAVVAKGQVRYGDVRRLQRDYLPGGITKREELELLISLNAKLVRADKTWPQWLVAAVAEFVANQQAGEHPVGEATGEWVGRLLAASTTRLGRRIGRELRRELGRRRGIQSTNADETHPKGIGSDDIAQQFQARAPKNSLDKRSLRRAKAQCAVRHKAIQGAAPLAGAAHGCCLAGYLPAVQRSHFMNFPSARVCVVLAPCQ